MTDLPGLCQALLNGPPSGTALKRGEVLLLKSLESTSYSVTSDAGIDDPEWSLAPSVQSTGTPSLQLLKSLAPLALLDGVWLARAAQPMTGHQETACRLLRIYSETVGIDDPSQSPPLRFRARLTNAGIHLPPIESPRFFEAGFPDPSLTAAAIALVLHHRPRRFAPEVLGFTLAHLGRKPESWDDPSLVPLRTRHLGWVKETKEIVVAEGMKEQRIHAGWHLYVSLLESIHEHCQRVETAPPRTPEDQFETLIRAKLPHAIGYHQKIMLADKPLDQWLQDAQNNTRPLLQALQDSPFINRSCPASSRLVRAMEFGGPMFGVFNSKERQSTLDWIENPLLPGGDTHDQPANAATIHRSGASQEIKPCSNHPSIPERLRLRDLYLSLLQAESPVDAPPKTERFVGKILSRGRHLCLVSLGSQPFPYSPDALNRFVASRHQTELQRYRPLTGAPAVDKSFCRWTLLQLAPAILSDGAWLSGAPTAAEKMTPAHRHLVKIYTDELGDGRAEWNHPNVYRRLLASQQLTLPDFSTEAFAHHPALLESAFTLPTYLLAMGLLSPRYQPEILGLNLAIELSGLGASYMRAIDILRFHGMDPTIVELHLSIDNLACGHAARAQEAIILFLDEVGQSAGWPEVQRVWERIWQGYQSFHAATIGLTVKIISRFALHRAGWRVDEVLSGLERVGFVRAGGREESAARLG